MDETVLQRIDMLAAQRKLAWLLGIIGLIPFIGCALLVLVLGITNPISEPVIEMFRFYSIVILSFLGGIRWGHALLRDGEETELPESQPLLGSIISPLIAWGTVFLNPLPAISLLLLAHCAQGAWDNWSAHTDKLPQWFSPVRVVLTLVVAAAHIVILLSLMT